jgi:ankyrin repeat protein
MIERLVSFFQSAVSTINSFGLPLFAFLWGVMVFFLLDRRRKGLEIRKLRLEVEKLQEDKNKRNSLIRGPSFEEIQKLTSRQNLHLRKKSPAAHFDADRETELIYAAKHGYLEVMRSLLDGGENVDQSDGRGWSALTWAVTWGQTDNHLKSIELLLERAADANNTEEDGLTPLQWALHFGNIKGALMLLENGADPNVRNKEGKTPLMDAAMNGYPEVVEHLLRCGAEVDAETPLAFTALLLASMNGRKEVVEHLIRRGAAINKKDSKYGRSPVLWATMLGHSEVVELLLDAEADVTLSDKEGNTALNWAEEKENEDILNLIKSRGSS